MESNIDCMYCVPRFQKEKEIIKIKQTKFIEQSLLFFCLILMNNKKKQSIISILLAYNRYIYL